MNDPTDAQRLVRKGTRLARQAAAALAQAADAAEPAAPAAEGARVVATFAAVPGQDPAVLARKIENATRTHGALDVLLVTDHTTTAPNGAQEDAAT